MFFKRGNDKRYKPDSRYSCKVNMWVSVPVYCHDTFKAYADAL